MTRKPSSDKSMAGKPTTAVTAIRVASAGPPTAGTAIRGGSDAPRTAATAIRVVGGLTAAAEPADAVILKGTAIGGGARVGGERFGPYELEQLLGRGGMGEVWRAYDTLRGRAVALKRLHSHLADSPQFQLRFRREAALAARLNDPHVIPIHDYGEVDGRLYIDMRLVEGVGLNTLLSTFGPLDPVRAVDIVSQTGGALAAAHDEGLVHRDVKPSNVLLTDKGSDGREARDFVYLVDFGIAHTKEATSMTSTGFTVGTLAYLAPERFDGLGDHRVDVYALGCLLYEALTASRPFPVEGLPALLKAHLNTPAPRPSALRPGLPGGLDEVVATAMAKSPGDRYPSATALAVAARAAVAQVRRPAAHAVPAVSAPVPTGLPPGWARTLQGPPLIPAATPQPRAAAQPRPAAQPRAAAQPRPAAQPRAAAQPAPAAQPRPAAQPTPRAQQPKPAAVAESAAPANAAAASPAPAKPAAPAPKPAVPAARAKPAAPSARPLPSAPPARPKPAAPAARPKPAAAAPRARPTTPPRPRRKGIVRRTVEGLFLTVFTVFAAIIVIMVLLFSHLPDPTGFDVHPGHYLQRHIVRG